MHLHNVLTLNANCCNLVIAIFPNLELSPVRLLIISELSLLLSPFTTEQNFRQQETIKSAYFENKNKMMMTAQTQLSLK